MSRQRKPTNVLERSGAFRKNPSRRRDEEPDVNEPFPKAPPEHLTQNDKDAWRTIVKAVPAGVLTGADVLIVEITAKLYAELRYGDGKMETGRVAQLRIAMGSLGLSPADRAKLSVKKDSKNPFDDI